MYSIAFHNQTCYGKSRGKFGCYYLSKLFIFWYYDLTFVLFYLMLFYYINLIFTYKKMFYFLVEFNGTRVIGDFTPCSRTLVY
jgi:hypothetical protein